MIGMFITGQLLLLLDACLVERLLRLVWIMALNKQ